MTKHLHNFMDTGRCVIQEEILALSNLEKIINEDFNRACEMIINCTGRVIWIGVGQSWHVGRKTACSMASLGKPSFYIHATEAVHGDMGLITKDDVVILISHSGKTKEILATLGPINYIGSKKIAIVGNLDSPLAKACDITLTTGVKEEAGPIKFAPSSSALTTTSLGDALVMSIATAIGFDEIAYSKYHPGGAIGEELQKKLGG